MKSDKFQELLKRRIEGHFTDYFVAVIEDSPERFDEIYTLITNPDKTVSWRAAWVCKKLCDKHPDWFMPHIQNLTEMAISPRTYQGTRHQLINILNDLPLEKPMNVNLLNFCFEHMTHPAEKISIQALCMKIAYKMCCQEPELMKEFNCIIDSTDYSMLAAGLKAVIRNIKNKKAISRKFS